MHALRIQSNVKTNDSKFFKTLRHSVIYNVQSTLKINKSHCSVGKDCLFAFFQKILQTDWRLVVLASWTMTSCGFLGGLQRFGQRAASIFSACPALTLITGTALFYDINTYWEDNMAQDFKIPVNVSEYTASWTPQFLQHWPPEHQ